MRLALQARGLIALLVLSALVCQTGGPAAARENPPQESSVNEPTPKTPAWERLVAASKLKAENKSAEAAAAFEQALVLAREENDQRAQANALRGIGNVAVERAEYQKARANLEQALALYESLNDERGKTYTLSSLGILAEKVGEHPRARELYAQALQGFEALGDKRGQLRMIYELRPPEELLGRAREFGDRQFEAWALNSIAAQDFLQGRFGDAGETLQQAALIFRELQDARGLSAALMQMGRNLRAQGHPELAISFYEEAFQLRTQYGNKTDMLESMNAIGLAHGYLGDHRKAKEFYERALQLAEATGSPRNMDFMRGQLAGNAMATGECARAVEMLQPIIERGADTNLANRYSQLASALLCLNRNEAALAAAEQSVALSRNREGALPGRLAERAEALRRVGKGAEAAASLQQALQILDRQRANLTPSDFLKRGFTAQSQQVYAQAIALNYHLGHPEQALEIAERARGRAFLDLLASRDLTLREGDKALLAEIRQKELADEAALPAPAAPSNSFANLTLRGPGPETLKKLEKLGAGEPRIASFAATEALTVAEMQQLAGRLQSALVSYWVADNEIFIWVVSRGSIQSARVALPAGRLEELVRLATGRTPAAASSGKPSPRLAARSGGEMTIRSSENRAWRELYQLLVAPIRRYLPPAGHSRITVIPHGSLSSLSFAALKNEKGRYLIEEFSLHYVPATALLRFTQPQKHTAANSSGMLLVADPELPPPASKLDRPLPRLPGAREEVRAIAAAVAGDDVKVLLGAEATEAAVRREMQGQRVLHLAAHGIVNNEQPFESYVALGRRPDAADDDGRITASEIYAFDLRAELVVLSTCRSGGAVLNGDGVAAMARGFFYAGAPSLIFTLWDVADDPSKRLLPEFYRHWRRTGDKSEALRVAQIGLLRDLRNGRVKVSTPAGNFVLAEDPAFWAAYVLLGEP